MLFLYIYPRIKVLVKRCTLHWCWVVVYLCFQLWDMRRRGCIYTYKVGISVIEKASLHHLW